MNVASIRDLEGKLNEFCEGFKEVKNKSENMETMLETYKSKCNARSKEVKERAQTMKERLKD